jgi:glyoxylase-like metal-dependent hydrolase (beta-lactamase superfamily II)
MSEGAMRPSRRAVLAGGAALAALSACPVASHALATPHRLTIGEFGVTVLSDGTMSLPVPVMLPATPTNEAAALLTGGGLPTNAFTNQLNVALIERGAERILVDTGGGLEFVPGIGKLEGGLSGLGIEPSAIGRIVFTHGHADHLWGVVDPLTGEAAFDKAQLSMSLEERDTWLSPDIEARVGDPFKAMAAGSHSRMKTLASRISTFAPGGEIAPGIQVLDTGGHTPGHVSLLLRSGADQLLIGGDVLIQSVVSFAAPDWRWSPDMDHDRAVRSRRRMLDMLAADRVLLLGYHLPWPGVGRVEKAGRAYRFVPV